MSGLVRESVQIEQRTGAKAQRHRENLCPHTGMSPGSVRSSSLPPAHLTLLFWLKSAGVLCLLLGCLTQHCYSSHSHFGRFCPILALPKVDTLDCHNGGDNATGIKRVELILQCKELQLFFCRKNAKYCLVQNISIAEVDKPWVILFHLCPPTFQKKKDALR